MSSNEALVSRGRLSEAKLNVPYFDLFLLFSKATCTCNSCFVSGGLPL